MAKSSKDSLGHNVENKIQITLLNVFKHDHFKSKTQEAAVHAVLKGEFLMSNLFKQLLHMDKTFLCIH
jgi:hypothetical protein